MTHTLNNHTTGIITLAIQIGHFILNKFQWYSLPAHISGSELEGNFRQHFLGKVSFVSCQVKVSGRVE